MSVAKMESRMINLENDFCWLKAIRCAMKEEIFTIKVIVWRLIENQMVCLFVLYNCGRKTVKA